MIFNVDFAFKFRIIHCGNDLYMSQMNPKEFFRNTACSVQLPFIAGLSLKIEKNKLQ